MTCAQGGRQCILLVEDDKVTREAIRSILQDAYVFVEASTAEEALRLLRQGVQPDLVLLDVRLPDMDGYSMFERLRNEGFVRDMLVIFLTGQWGEADEARGLGLGAVDYIRKPVSAPVLRARIHNHLQLKRHRDMLLDLSHLDGLTNIPNRRRLDEVFARQWALAGRKNTPMALLFVDIDHFKAYNDTYGHLAGDDCLQQVARVLFGSVKRPCDLVARFGGEEFVALLPETDLAGAWNVAERMRRAVEALGIPHASSPVAPQVTVSVGGCVCQECGRFLAEAMLACADQALYAAKSAGRNRISMHRLAAAADGSLQCQPVEPVPGPSKEPGKD
ncbi:diguanylate cyclase response regulator [Thermodesulfomicrobium sp. WS]|uniref:diguanylate cyclase domain-containing protein n=1 Tax=Thermodesulfomicrobium sp. WS TaxID=3004129 RepID=UPI002491AE1C|nr:diguanylate cyclase [Thermodesulfomicrobium sp. WS]BDV01349.1 diguanylate cyclase response regulator [Thermodesulfomicrobium sp. WS]